MHLLVASTLPSTSHCLVACSRLDAQRCYLASPIQVAVATSQPASNHPPHHHPTDPDKTQPVLAIKKKTGQLQTAFHLPSKTFAAAGGRSPEGLRVPLGRLLTFPSNPSLPLAPIPAHPALSFPCSPPLLLWTVLWLALSSRFDARSSCIVIPDIFVFLSLFLLSLEFWSAAEPSCQRPVRLTLPRCGPRDTRPCSAFLPQDRPADVIPRDRTDAPTMQI